MSLEKSVQRLKNSRIESDRHKFNLKDIEYLFSGYNDMSEHDKENGSMVIVDGKKKSCLDDRHIILYDADGNVCYNGNESHPCPPYEDCGGG